MLPIIPVTQSPTTVAIRLFGRLIGNVRKCSSGNEPVLKLLEYALANSYRIDQATAEQRIKVHCPASVHY